MPASVLGLDIGGANLKATHAAGTARSVPFALWRTPAGLTDALSALVATMPPFDRLAVTMTGELCDCWDNKRQGVEAILNAVAAVAGERPVRVWTNQGSFVDPERARRVPGQVASANWLALAAFAGRFAPQGPLLLDIGTTTTDVIPLHNGKPAPKGRTDPDRLRSGELLYAGWKRTPVCALYGTGGAAELFATLQDVYLVLGAIPERPDETDTADGRPATRKAACPAGRMLLLDPESAITRPCDQLAHELNFKLVNQIALTIEQVVQAMPEPPATVVTAGSGEFLVRPLWQAVLLPAEVRSAAVVSLAERIGPERSASACAHAVATLAAEREG
ncbi:MAG: hydantoinase/oxoprolinase family protein [Gemmataceae bacterium]